MNFKACFKRKSCKSIDIWGIPLEKEIHNLRKQRRLKLHRLFGVFTFCYMESFESIRWLISTGKALLRLHIIHTDLPFSQELTHLQAKLKPFCVNWWGVWFQEIFDSDINLTDPYLHLIKINIPGVSDLMQNRKKL